jgi:hypothetical protein
MCHSYTSFFKKKNTSCAPRPSLLPEIAFKLSIHVCPSHLLCGARLWARRLVVFVYISHPSYCLQRMPPRAPSPITVAGIGATVPLYPLHRVPPPPPLPSRFLLSPAKWMATLRRRSFSQPLPSQTRARARNTPRKTPEAIRGRPNRRRRRYASIRRRP